VDIEKHVTYWSDGTLKAFRSVPHLIEHGFVVEALFWTHLAVEKALKAHVTRTTGAVPPYTHNLVRLAELSAVSMNESQKRVCVELTRFQGMGRYPDIRQDKEPDLNHAKQLIAESEHLWRWLLNRL